MADNFGAQQVKFFVWGSLLISLALYCSFSWSGGRMQDLCGLATIGFFTIYTVQVLVQYFGDRISMLKAMVFALLCCAVNLAAAIMLVRELDIIFGRRWEYRHFMRTGYQSLVEAYTAFTFITAFLSGVEALLLWRQMPIGFGWRMGGYQNPGYN